MKTTSKIIFENTKIYSKGVDDDDGTTILRSFLSDGEELFLNKADDDSNRRFIYIVKLVKSNRIKPTEQKEFLTYYQALKHFDNTTLELIKKIQKENIISLSLDLIKIFDKYEIAQEDRENIRDLIIDLGGLSK